MSARDEAMRLPAECRSFRAAIDAAVDAPHARACAACADAMALRARLAAGLRAKPTPPANFGSRDFLASIHARIVDGIEAQSAIAPRIADPVTPPAELAPHAGGLDVGLAKALAAKPAMPTDARWSEVRRAVIHDIAAQRASRARIAVWFGLMGAAAAALFVVLSSNDGPAATPRIVFADLATPPTGDFAVVRRGAER